MDFLSTADIQELVQSLETWIEDQILSWDLWLQVAIAATLGLLAFAAHKNLRPRADRFFIDRQLHPALRRLALSASGLIGIILLLLALTFVTILLRERSPGQDVNFLQTVISLAAAWAVIRLTASVITSRTVARVIAVAVWTLAALDILGLLDPIMRALDSVGMPLGTGRVTLLTLINGAVLLAALMWGAMFTAGLMSQRLLASPAVSPRTQVLVVKITRFVLISLAILITLSSIGVNLAALAVFTGALGVGIGIGLQRQVSNLISGLLLLLDKSIKPGDVIEVNQTYGWVREMSARYVGVVTRDNKDILIPNDTFITDQVVNWSRTERTVRLEVKFGVAFDADPNLVRELAATAARTPRRVVAEPPPLCHLVEFGESRLNFVLRFWITDPEAGVINIKGEVLLALWEALKKAGIAVPYPHRYVILAEESSPRR